MVMPVTMCKFSYLKTNNNNGNNNNDDKDNVNSKSMTKR